ncbi:hypothetical protein L6164_018144 [Bauhinia variegata]|uniref:Uncharacterized protein n=1 Tax=Bauhinia variegata TaxID=167791 RepID=A0ACB9NDP7_BAUVA|nr:hypothetical protein L6164_018144 [Bauhinia variegata]
MSNNNLGMQNQPQLGANNHPNLMMPFMPNSQPSMTLPPFVNGTNHFQLLQNNQLGLPYMGLAGPATQQVQFHGGFPPQNGTGNMNCTPMFPVNGQIMQNAAQISLSQPQGQILAQNMMNMLQQHNMNMNMNMPNGQSCPTFPLQNLNQHLLMQGSNPSQGVPFSMPSGSFPMFGFPNHVPQAMVPQNPIFSTNPQLGPVNGSPIRPQVNQNQKNMVPPTAMTNAFVSAPVASQQFQGNTSAPINSNPIQQHHTKTSRPSSFTKSQGNPRNNVKTNVPNSNWKQSPNKNFKNKSIRGGFQKSKFHNNNNGNRKFGFPKENRGKELRSGMAGNFGVNSEEQNSEPKRGRSLSVTYTEQEIQQWREARRKNYPTKINIQKKQNESLKESKVVDKEVLRKELKEILSKQAELGVEVAEVPSYYLLDSGKRGIEMEEKKTFTNQGKFRNKFDKRKSGKNDRFAKRQKLANSDFSNNHSLNKREPTLLQKLLNKDVKRDKCHLLQVLKFTVMNSFFKDWPEKPLRYPSVIAKETEKQAGVEENNLHSAVNKVVNSPSNKNDDHEIDCNEHITAHNEASEEEEGEIID